jgi:ribonuclease T2
VFNRNSAFRSLAALAALSFIFGGSSIAKSHKKKPANSPEFSYYMLVLSYAPDFCAEPQGQKDPRECGNGRHVGFVVHGLWPQGETTRGPEKCGPARPVPQAVVQATLKYIPTEALIQHEWAAHGTCSGLSVADYFSAVAKARDSVSIPAEFQGPSQRIQLRPDELEAKFAAANPAFPSSAFRTSCYNDAELKEIRVCINKDLSPRACGPSAGECTAASVTVLPVR